MPSAAATPKVYNSPRAQARQQRILQVVREQITLHGFDGVTMQELADKAGVVKKTLYNIYGGKDELLIAAVGELVGEYRRLPESIPAGVQSIIESRRIAVETVAENGAYATAMLQSLMRVPADHRLVQVLLRDAVAFTEEHLAVDVAAGRLSSDIDCNQLAKSIIAQGFGLTVLFAKELISPADMVAVSLQGLQSVLDPHIHDTYERTAGGIGR